MANQLSIGRDAAFVSVAQLKSRMNAGFGRNHQLVDMDTFVGRGPLRVALDVSRPELH